MTHKNTFNDFDSLKTENGGQVSDQFLHSQVESDHLIKSNGGGRVNWKNTIFGGKLQLASDGGQVEKINSSLGESKVRLTGFLEGIPQVWTAEGDFMTRVSGCDQKI